jgi:MFS family permease
MNLIVVALSVSYVVMIPAYLFAGIITVKIGMKKLLVISAVAYGMSILVSGIVTNVYLFIFFMGILSSFAMYGVFLASIALINVLVPEKKGTAMGLLYAVQTLGAAAFAPLANFFILRYSVTTSLIIEGIVFTVLMLVGSILIKDPTQGNKELMKKIQDEAEAEEIAEAMEGKQEVPSMRWRKALRHRGIYILLLSIILVQMFGNVVTADGVVLATTIYGVSSTVAAYLTSIIGIGGAVGAAVVGIISDKIGPFRTTFLLSILDGLVLIALAISGTHSFLFFAIVITFQMFTYNGLNALNAIMMTDAYHPNDLGVMMAMAGVAMTIVGIIGPQIGLSMPFVPMVAVCAVCAIVGGILCQPTVRSINKYYESIGSLTRVR